MPKFDNLPAYFEELKIKEDSTLQEVIAQFKQSIPSNFLKLEPAKKNNWGSTEGLDKPLCERYLFSWENKRIWLDIPQELMNKLGLPIGKTFPWPFYLNPKVLEKEEIEGAITIENEKEFMLDSPRKITMKDQQIQTEPNEEEFNKLKEELETQKQNYLDLERLKNGEITELRNQLKKWTDQFPNENANQVQIRINSLNSQIVTLTSNQLTQSELNAISYVQTVINSSLCPGLSQRNITYFNNYQSYFNSGGVLSPSYYSTYGRMNSIIQGLYNFWGPARLIIEQFSSLQTQLSTANSELQKEKGWWDKWINDVDSTASFSVEKNEIIRKNLLLLGWNKSSSISLQYSFKWEHQYSDIFYGAETSSVSVLHSSLSLPDARKKSKLLVKAVYLHYRDK